MKPLRSVEDLIEDFEGPDAAARSAAETALAEALASDVVALREKAVELMLARLRDAGPELTLRLLAFLQAYFWYVPEGLGEAMVRDVLAALDRLADADAEPIIEDAALLLARAIQADEAQVATLVAHLPACSSQPRCAVLGALARAFSWDTAALDAVAQQARVSTPAVRAAAVRALGAHVADHPERIVVLLGWAAEQDLELKRAAFAALHRWAFQLVASGKVATPAVAPSPAVLLSAAADPDDVVRMEAVGLLALAAGQLPRAEEVLVRALADPHTGVAGLAAAGLIRKGARLDLARALLERQLMSSTPGDNEAAHAALDGLRGDELARISALVETLARKDPHAADLLRERLSSPG